MITAHDALNITIEAAAAMVEHDAMDIEKAIREAAERGLSHCNYYHAISKQTQEYMSKMGYNVRDYSSQKDGILFRIQWDGR